jgi:hypothetical protein
MKNLLGIAMVLAAAASGCSDGSGTNPPNAGSGGSTSGSGGSDGSGGTSSGGSTASGGSTGDTGGSQGTGGSDVQPDSGTGGQVGGNDAGPVTGDGGLVPSPLLPLLDQFTAPDVPKKGPSEADPIVLTGTTTPDSFPGEGLAQHPMLYAGEGNNTIYLVNGGKVIWTYSTGKGGEIDDVWMLSNAHVLYARMSYLEEITPKKEVVWHYTCPANTEAHSLQPIGLDKVLFVQNGQPAKIIVMNKMTMAKEVEHELPDTLGVATHPQFRRIRMTATGNYLAPYLNLHKVVEYDKDFNVVWNYPVADMGSPWSAIRLHNGNTLIQDEHNKASREVNSKGEIVWELKLTDIPAEVRPGSAPQTSDRFVNGNTVVFSRNGVQIVEVDANKQVVWALNDRANLGPATTAQFLDQPGIPENPGELQH